jgi:hypothetical protein
MDYLVNQKNYLIAEALVHRCGGSTLYAMRALCFPFNRRHDHVCEHQNSTILKGEAISSKFNCHQLTFVGIA